jgi:predicted transcriptional regulator
MKQTYNTALYMRLSRDDENYGDSVSIETQRTILRQFAKEADIPYSTLMTLLSRGLGGASFDVVLQICKKLNIDPYTL